MRLSLLFSSETTMMDTGAIWSTLDLDQSSLNLNQVQTKLDTSSLVPLLNTKATEEQSWNDAISMSVKAYNTEAEHLPYLFTFKQDTLAALDEAGNTLDELAKTLEQTEQSAVELRARSQQCAETAEATDIALTHLSGFIDQMFVEPGLIRHIVDGKVGDEYYSHCLTLLSKKVALFEMEDVKKCAVYSEVKPVLDKLVITAISRVRSFLVDKTSLLKRPNTNVNIIKESVLLPHRALVEFIEQHAPVVFKEVKNSYVETMSKTYYVLFKRYTAGLLTMKEILPSEHGDTLVGSLSTPSSMDRLWSTSSSIGRRTDYGGGSNSTIRSNSSSGSGRVVTFRSAGVTQFSLGDRLDVLRDVEGPAIVLATAVDNNQRFFYEQIHRSLGKMLSETCASEHLFCEHFFGEGGGRMFDVFFQRIVGILLDAVKTHTAPTRDTLGVLLALKVNEAQRSSMQMRNIKDLSDFFIQVDIVLKPKFKKLLDENIQSISEASSTVSHARASSYTATSSSSSSPSEVDCGPHIVTRRCAEFIASLLAIARFGTPDDSIMEGLRRLRAEFNGFLNSCAKLFTRPKPRFVFLVNNIDFLLSIMKQRNVANMDDYRFFAELNDVHTAAYVEHEVADHFPDIISFVRQFERAVKVAVAAQHPSGTRRGHASEDRVKAVLRQFASNWKLGVQHMQDGVLREFPNYELGTELMRSLFSRLLAYHKRCDAAIQSYYPTLVNDVVPSSEIVQELRQRANQF